MMAMTETPKMINQKQMKRGWIESAETESRFADVRWSNAAKTWRDSNADDLNVIHRVGKIDSKIRNFDLIELDWQNPNEQRTNDLPTTAWAVSTPSTLATLFKVAVTVWTNEANTAVCVFKDNDSEKYKRTTKMNQGQTNQNKRQKEKWVSPPKEIMRTFAG